MRFRTALALGAAGATFATLATLASACSSFGTTSETTDIASTDAATEGSAIDGGVPIGDASADGGPATICSKPLLVDPFTAIDQGWEQVGGGTFTVLPAGNPMRQAVIASVDLSSKTGQEAYLQRYVPLPTPPTSVRLQYGYYAGGNTAGSASVGCRLQFLGSTATSELLLYHQTGKSNVRLERAVGTSIVAGIDTFPYESSMTATGAEWHDVDLRVDITGSAGAVTLVGYDTTLLGHLLIPPDPLQVRLRCGAALLDYSSGILSVGMSKLELDVCP